MNMFRPHRHTPTAELRRTLIAHKILGNERLVRSLMRELRKRND